MIAQQRGLRIDLAYGAQCRGRREQRTHPVLLDHSPERARVGGADGLALVQHRRRSGQQRAVDDVAVADHPAHVRGGPHDLAGSDVIDVGHRPAQRDGVSAVVPDDALRLPGGARRVEDVERIGRRDRHGIRGGRGVEFPMEVQPVARRLDVDLRSAREEDRTRGRRRHGEGRGDGCHVVDGASGFETTSGGHDRDGIRVVDARGQFLRGEPAEHHRVDRTEARTGEHRDDGLRDHRHVEHDAITRTDAASGERPREAGHPVEEFGVGERHARARHGGIVDQRGPIAGTGRDVAVERVDARVQSTVREPAVEGCVRRVQGDGRRDVPVDRPRRLEPEGVGVGGSGVVGLAVGARFGHEPTVISAALP